MANDHRKNAAEESSGKVPARVMVRVQTYGTCTVDVGGVRLGRNADIVIALILLLTHSPNMQLPRDSALELLWPESPEKRQRGNLRQALYKLRQMGIHASLHGDQVELDAAQLEPTFSIRRDVASFDAQVLPGHEPLGQFLAGYDAGGNVPLSAWIENERERANGDVRRALSTALNARRLIADWAAAEPLARWLLQFDPLNEAATLVMSECLLMSGAKYEAIRLLDRYMSELGPDATDLRIPAATLRRRIAAPAVRRISFAPTERHFVGREGVMAELTLCMRRARHHDGTATLLHGSAGMGKTRVLNELSKIAVMEGIRDVRTGCRETDVNRPLSIFLEVVPELLQLPGALGCAPEGLQALRRFVNDDSVESDRTSNGQASIMPLAAGLRRSIVDLIVAVAEEKPLMFVLEDVHWLDAASWEVIVDLVDVVRKSRVCLLMTSRLTHARPVRPERLPIDLVMRALGPLSVDSRLELVQAIATDLAASIDDELGDWFAHSSEGVPLFLRSLVNHWIETGDAGGIPPTLQGVIGQRVQNLSQDALHVLQTVTLLSRHADLEMIESVLALPYFRVMGSLDELHKAGAFDADVDGIVVCHELIGRMSIDALGKNARRSLHKRIAAIMMEREARDGVAPVLCRDRLGHLLNAGDPKAFLDAAISGIRILLNAGFHYDALGVSDAALENADNAGAERDILRLQAEALYACGEYARLLSHPSSPSSIVQGISQWDKEDPHALIRWIDSAAYAGTTANTTELAAAAVHMAETTTKAADVRFAAASLALRITSNCCDEGLARRAYESGIESAALLELPVQRGQEIEMLYQTCFGESEKAALAATELLRRLPSITTVTERLSAKMRIAFSLRCCGRIEQALQLFGEIHLEAKAEHLGSIFSFAAWRVSLLHLDFNDISLAIAWHKEFAALAPVEREPLAAMIFHNHSVRMALVAGDISGAKYQFECAHNRMPSHGHYVRHATALSHTLAIGRKTSNIGELNATLPTALKIFSITRNAPGQSFFASEIALGLRAVGSTADATTHLKNFLERHRREPGPVPKCLKDAATFLEISDVVKDAENKFLFSRAGHG